MRKQRQNYFLNLLKATRVGRVLPVLIIILIPAAYSNKFPLTLLLLGLVAVLIYSAASIHNAYRDKDSEMPKYFPLVIFILLGTALIISSFEKIIFITSIVWITLGYVYNTISRYVIYGDNLIAGLTHFVVPITASSLLVGLGLKTIIPLTTITYLLALCIGPVTNLKDIKEDKRRGYKTLVNSVRKPYSVAAILFDFSFIFIFILYAFLITNGYFLLFLTPVFILKSVIINRIYSRRAKEALNLMRFYLIFSFIFLIFSLIL